MWRRQHDDTAERRREERNKTMIMNEGNKTSQGVGYMVSFGCGREAGVVVEKLMEENSKDGWGVMREKRQGGRDREGVDRPLEKGGRGAVGV